MASKSTLCLAGLLVLSLAQGCGTKFSACSEDPCSGAATATGSGGTGGSSGPSAGSEVGGSATGGGGGTRDQATSSSAGQAGAAGAPDSPASNTDGATGGAGGSSPLPCEGACGGPTPACDEATDTCVECLDSSAHCDTPTPACNPDSHECVECVEPSDCAEGVCDTEASLCVECLESGDCTETAPLCDVEQQFCVECLGNPDCSIPTEARCNAGSCSPCQTSDDCAHLTGTTVCDVDTGQCVECTVAEEAVCGGTSCNPATRTCTNTELGSVGSCEPCVADSECIGHDQAEPLRRCVPMEFNGEPREKAYCLVRRSQVSECAKPFVMVMPAVSLSGSSEESYCGIAQDSVTCEAVRDFLRARSCPGGQDTECGCPRDEDGNCTAPGQGGFCRDLPAFDNQCTYQCGNDNQCPDTFACADQDPDFCQ